MFRSSSETKKGGRCQFQASASFRISRRMVGTELDKQVAMSISKHATKTGKITVPHPVKDLPIGTLKSIEKASGVKLR